MKNSFQSLSYKWFLLLLPLLLCQPVTAETAMGPWQSLGRLHLLSSNETATLKVIHKIRETPFQIIKFHASSGSVHLQKARIHMEDGRVIRVSIQKTILAGLDTREFPIPSQGQGIRKIELHYLMKEKHPVDITVLGQSQER
ncbi:MAG: hypothetical protein ACR2PT_08190 [Endozoicomonas sp.]